MCFINESDDVCELWHEATPKARKDHKCSECRGVIPRGSLYRNIQMLWEGKWDTVRQCFACLAVIEEIAKIEKTKGCHDSESRPQLLELGSALNDVEYWSIPGAEQFRLRRECAGATTLQMEQPQ